MRQESRSCFICYNIHKDIENQEIIVGSLDDYI